MKKKESVTAKKNKIKIQQRKYSLVIAVILSVFLIISVILAVAVLYYNRTEYVFQVNGLKVEPAELTYYMEEEKSGTAVEIEEKYGLIYNDAAFWSTKTQDTTPIEILRKDAADVIIRMKVEQLLAKEKGINTPLTFSQQKKANQKNNEQRVLDYNSGKTLYGPVEREFSVYLAEIMLQMKQGLIEEMIDKELKIPDTKLQEYYDQNLSKMVGEDGKTRTFEEQKNVIRNQLLNEAYDKMIDEKVKIATVKYNYKSYNAAVIGEYIKE